MRRLSIFTAKKDLGIGGGNYRWRSSTIRRGIVLAVDFRGKNKDKREVATCASHIPYASCSLFYSWNSAYSVLE